MDDEIPVNYDTIEQLFCQKEISKSTTDAPVHKVIPTKVGLYIYIFYIYGQACLCGHLMK